MCQFRVGDKVRLVPYETLVQRGDIRQGEDVHGITPYAYKKHMYCTEYTIARITEKGINFKREEDPLVFDWPLWCLEKVENVPHKCDDLKIPDIWDFAQEVTVLGAKYRIIQSTEAEEPRLSGCNGFTDWTSKKIVVHGRDVEGNLNDLKAHAKKVLRHEIVHAFLIESGLSYCTSSDTPWAESEELVDWIAWQGPKIMQAWKEAGCL